MDGYAWMVTLVMQNTTQKVCIFSYRLFVRKSIHALRHVDKVIKKDVQ